MNHSFHILKLSKLFQRVSRKMIPSCLNFGTVTEGARLDHLHFLHTMKMVPEVMLYLWPGGHSDEAVVVHDE
jgi:hypothetical protein